MEPILIELKDPLWFMISQAAGSFLGIVIVAIVTWKIANRRIRAVREEKWWNSKFDCFMELKEIFSDMYTFDETDGFTLSIGKSLQQLNNLGFKANVLFDDESLNNLINEIVVTLNAEKDRGVVKFTDNIIEGVSVKISDALNIMKGLLKKRD